MTNSYRTVRRTRSRILDCLLLVAATTLAGLAASSAAAQSRVVGLDVSSWQGSISTTTWNNLHNNDNQDFVFIRSSRGGTTGFYNQSDPNNNNGQNTLSQRYDDQYFMQNITRATNAGLLAGSYHFARPDIVSNTGTDEADHFIQMAGPWMRPGYLLPTFDLEAGQSQRTRNELAEFSVDFSDRIHEVLGIRPMIYVSGNYANYLQGASSTWQDAVVDAFPNFWAARWPNQGDPDSIPIQTAHPKDSYAPMYGPWDDAPNPTHPWAFWQYTSQGRLNSFNNGNSNLDRNVAQGGMEFLKDRLVPAVWTTDSDGQWTTVANWNSGQTPILPVHGPGQVPRVGFPSLPVVRLPGADDTVVLDRDGAALTVTLSSGTHSIRKLEVRETLNITGGSLTTNYVPVAESTPYSTRFSAPVSLDGGSLSTHTLQVDTFQDFSVAGTISFDTLNLMPHGFQPAELHMTGTVIFNPLDNAAAVIANGSGAGNTGQIDLGGADRTWQIAEGTSAVDLTIEVPIINGALTKTGAGTLALAGANTYDGDTTLVEGSLILDDSLLADAADVLLFSSLAATLDLDFAGSADIIDSLFIDGVQQAIGTWGALGSAADFTTSLITGTGMLQVTTTVIPIPGDFDGNGFVDQNDLTEWANGYGQNPGYNGADFLTWQRNLGNGAPPLASSQAIPEPSTLLLLTGLASLSLLTRRK